MARPEPERRAAARARAELFGWPQAVEGFLRAHGAPQPVVTRQARVDARALRPAAPGLPFFARGDTRAWATSSTEA
jgi:alpha-1,6-mannosyltransferase